MENNTRIALGKGFTLIELLVVIAIIAILSVVGITVFTGVQKSARDAKRRGDIEAISKAYEVQYSNSGVYNDPQDSDYAGGKPHPPGGGDYVISVNPDKLGFQVCATMESDSSKFCKQSTQGTYIAPSASPVPSSTPTSPSPSGSPTPAPSASPVPSSTPVVSPSPSLVPSALKSAVLIDSRLYEKIKTEVDSYIGLAKARRGFDIAIDSVSGIDDWSYTQVKDHIKALKIQYPGLEGVLLIGNIKMPSFYKPRADLTSVELIGFYYEDLDGVFERRQEPGSIDPKCPETEPYCNVFGNLTVPLHDFDYVAKGLNPGPELWVAYMPVGFADPSKNNFDGYAQQLRPYLQKVIGFYNGSLVPVSKFYQVSNQLWDLSGVWAAYGSSNIDFYSISPDPKDIRLGSYLGSWDYCLHGRTAEQCYVRAPMENYASFQVFQRYAGTRDWMGEDWQTPTIYKSHMQAQTYEFVWVNVHSSYDYSLISRGEARSLNKGGIVMLGTGCNVAGIRQPNSPSFANSWYPDYNILLAYLYGNSSFIAALGDTFNRAQDSYFEQMVPFVKSGDYLGKAHFRRKQIQYQNSDNPWVLKILIQEILYGDPYLEFNR